MQPGACYANLGVAPTRRSFSRRSRNGGAEPSCPPYEPTNPAPAGANEESPLNMHSSAERAARILPSAIALEDASVFGQGVSGRGVGACRAQLKRFG